MVSLATACALVAPLLAALPDDPPVRAPGPDAPALTVFMTTAQTGGLRYTWVVPEGYDGRTPRDLTVILHGTGLDYRWGHWNNKPGILRPDDIVVSVDGTSPNGASRLFLGEPKDAELFAQFLEELRTTFAVGRVFLYGHSQGGFFVAYFMGEHPEAVAGGVAHASGAWNWSKTPKDLKSRALVFMHGSGDPVVPYAQSPGARDHYVDKGFPRVHLRRLANYNHWPNAVRATEALDWCAGMTSGDAQAVLDCALSMLRVKPPDEYQWQSVVDFSGARQVLLRLTGKGVEPLTGVPDALAKDAGRWLARIDEHAEAHVKVLRPQLPRKGALELDGKPWLGHLLPLREDFRGVEPVEALLTSIGFDKAAEAHAKAARSLLDAWYTKGRRDADYAAAALESIGESFLFDGLPANLREQMQTWRKQDVDVGAKLAKRWSAWDEYAQALDEGWKQYEKTWKDWEGPEQER
jgi:predicted esterase